jgi:hypothetical protein
MQRTLFTAAALAAMLTGLTTPCRADWFNYVVRTSGLGWSDGYHAYDQCPPTRHHLSGRHPHAFPTWGTPTERIEPYYFEEPSYQSAPPAEELPSAPADANPRTPSPQARYQSQSPYFQALRAEQQGGLPGQPTTLQAHRPQNRPPF